MNPEQCEHCGGPVSSDGRRCESCGKKTTKPASPKIGVPSNGIARYESHRARDLAPSPRRVPFLLVLACFGPIHLGLSGIVAVLAVQGVRMGFGAACVPALAAVWVVYRGIKNYRLLAHGAAATAEVLSVEGTGWSYDSSDLSYCEGWVRKSVNYTGTIYRSQLRLWGPTGEHADFSLKGLKYKREIYIFDPRKPKRRLAAGKLHVPLVPDSSGQWKVWPQTIKKLAFFGFLSVVFATVVSFAILSSTEGVGRDEPTTDVRGLGG